MSANPGPSIIGGRPLNSAIDSVSASVAALPKGAKVLTVPTVTVTAALVLAANPARKLAVFANPQPGGGATVYLGPAAVTTSAYTVALAPGAAYLDADTSDAWYAVASSGSPSIAVTEVA